MPYDLPDDLGALIVRLEVTLGRKNMLNWSHMNCGDKRILAVTVTNFLDGVRHRAMLIPSLSAADCRGLVLAEDLIATNLTGIKSGMGNAMAREQPIEMSDSLPISNRLFLVTDKMQSPWEEIRESLAPLAKRLFLIDDEYWATSMKQRRPDVFLVHDSRDKAAIVRELAVALMKLGLVVWYDEFALQPGDRLSAKIDTGLTECRHAVVVVTPALLANTTWANSEISALLSASIANSRLVIPLWHGVDQAAVARRSAFLADTFAIVADGSIETAASQIYAAVDGPGGSTGRQADDCNC
jgi:hypothetical protein